MTMVDTAEMGYFIIRYIERFELDLTVGTGQDKPYPQIRFIPDGESDYRPSEEDYRRYDYNAQRRLKKVERSLINDYNLQKKRETSKALHIPYNKRTYDSKLDELILEIELFIRKWRTSTFLKTCYRRDIELKGMWGNRGKIREHSRQISKKIRPLQNLHIGGIDTTISLLSSITDKMVDLGLEVETTFQSAKKIAEISKSEPNKIKHLISDGDKICHDLNDIISRLEKSRAVF
jgi:hypothetical protein